MVIFQFMVLPLGKIVFGSSYQVSLLPHLHIQVNAIDGIGMRHSWICPELVNAYHDIYHIVTLTVSIL